MRNLNCTVDDAAWNQILAMLDRPVVDKPR